MNLPSLLHRLGRHFGIQSVYRDGLGELRQAPTEAILGTLQALGAAIHRLDDLEDAWRQCRQARWQRTLEPVTVVWQDQPLRLKIRLPCQLAQASSSYRLVLEDGATLAGELSDDPAFTSISLSVENCRYVTRRLLGCAPVPTGYHRIYLRVGALEVDSHLICAPTHAFSATQPGAKRWGLFCPLYALRSERSWGVGDFSDLKQLSEFTAERGGYAVATLPMLANFLDEPFNPSPYAPVSRLFWNELFLDVEAIAELQQSAEAKTILSASFATEVQKLGAVPLVDYRRLMALKRQVLDAMARSLSRQCSERRDLFERYIATHPVAQDYAEFRAKTEGERQSWLHWTGENRDGVLRPDDFNADAKRYHLYVQWQCEEQTAALHEHARARGTALYLDFPLGVNRDGYDVWREQRQFALHVSGGAPPDGLFTRGQNWGFPPLHPEQIRQQGYRYYRACLRHHMSTAAMLRIDHVMGLHRAYWVPQGFDATQGVYVQYRAAEFYAILNLESQRHRVEIVGENLGTVPNFVNVAMARHHIRGMHVGQFAVNADPATALDEIPAPVVASLNTHDTPTFMGFWQGNDIADRVSLGTLDAAQAETERCYRAAQRTALITFLRAREFLSEDASAEAVLKGWLRYLAGQPDDFLQINLEDLWLEAEPQNVPGTWRERPNWQRRARYALDTLRCTQTINDFLESLSDIRGGMS